MARGWSPRGSYSETISKAGSLMPNGLLTTPVTSCRGRAAERPRSAVGALELAGELDEGLHPFDRRGVVHAHADAADGAMALDAHDAVLLGLGDHRLLELLAREPEDGVHHRAALALDGRAEEV